VLKYVPFLLAATIVAPAQEALDILRRTAETYKSAKSYALEGVDKVEEASRSKQRMTTRRFQASKLGESMRVDFEDGGVRLTDGRAEWNSPAQGRPYTKKAAPWDSRGRRAF
jgi:hypothetical protein